MNLPVTAPKSEVPYVLPGHAPIQPQYFRGTTEEYAQVRVLAQRVGLITCSPAPL